MLRTFLLWCTVTGTVYAAVGGGLHLYLSRQPERILVVVDSSFAMRAEWPAVVEVLQRLNTQKRYRQFALATEKSPVHDWQPTLSWGNIRAYGPRRLQRLLEKDELFGQTADQRIFVTSQTQDTDKLQEAGWDIILLPK